MEDNEWIRRILIERCVRIEERTPYKRSSSKKSKIMAERPITDMERLCGISKWLFWVIIFSHIISTIVSILKECAKLGDFLRIKGMFDRVCANRFRMCRIRVKSFWVFGPKEAYCVVPGSSIFSGGPVVAS